MTWDDTIAVRQIGFDFEFYGTLETQITIDTNGNLQFGSRTRTHYGSGFPFPPWDDYSQRAIAPLYNDLVPIPGAVYINLLGEAPNRRLIVTWFEMRSWFGSNCGPQTFQAQLFEGSNQIQFGYNGLDVTFLACNANVGIARDSLEYILTATDPEVWALDGTNICYIPENGTYREERVPCSPSQPSIECSPNPVVRGQIVDCRIIGSVDAVTGWLFEGFTPDGLPAPTPSGSSSMNWSGVAVLSGTVSAFVTRNGIQDTLTGALTVDDRSAGVWQWDENDWDFQPDAGRDCGYPEYEIPAAGAFKVVLARNTSRYHCKFNSIDPIDVEEGYDEAQVPDGPNRGLWYVTAAHYRMDRGSHVNPSITAGYVTHELTWPPSDVSACRDSLGLRKGDPVMVNFYTYNDRCQDTNLAGMFEGIYNHEGFGTKDRNAPDANGHQARIIQAAQLTENNPYQVAEKSVYLTPERLHDAIASEIADIDDRIYNYSNDHNYVKDNWCGDHWIFKESENKYVKQPLLQEGGSCI